MIRTTMIRCALALCCALIPAAATAQVGNALPKSLGMGGNYVSVARGFSSVLWNPAGLGMPDNPGVSFTFLPFNGSIGMGPITPGDLAGFNGDTIPHSVRLEWLDRIHADGGESGAFGTDFTYMAISIGRVGLSASSNVRGRMNVAPDVAEIFLFGNAGRTGDPRDFTLAGSEFDMAVTTTVAASLGLPFRIYLGPFPDQHFSLGATVKYTVGNFLLLGQEQGSSLSASPLDVEVRFPLIHTFIPEEDEDVSPGELLDNGSGIGLDVGAAWQGGIFSAGVAIRNLFNTFAWRTDDLQYRAGTMTFNADTSYTSFDEQPFEDAPQELVDRIDRLHTFSPVLAAGAAARVLPFLLVSGEMRHSLEDNLDIGVQNHLGVGAELTILPWFPLRAGLGVNSGGYQLSGGLGLHLGGVQLSFAAALRETEQGGDVLAALGLSFGLR